MSHLARLIGVTSCLQLVLKADGLVLLRAVGLRVLASVLPLTHFLSLGPGHIIQKVNPWEGLFQFPNFMLPLEIDGDLSRMEQKTICLKVEENNRSTLKTPFGLCTINNHDCNVISTREDHFHCLWQYTEAPTSTKLLREKTAGTAFYV